MVESIAGPEIGYVNGRGIESQPWDEDERVADLQWPYSVHMYARMMREDGRVSSLLQAIGLPIRRTTWRIEPNGASDEVTEFVAQNLRLPISGADPISLPRMKNRFSWGNHLQSALLMLPYGHSVFEQVMQPSADRKRVFLHKLAPRPQKSIDRFRVAHDGGLESVRQAPPSSDGKVIYGPGGIDIPISRLVVYARDPEPGVWTGSSILRPAYKHWLLKDELMRTQAAAARRNGIGVPVATAPPGEQDIAKYQRMASKFKGGMESGMGLPFDAKFELKGVQGALLDIAQAIDYHDKQIALAGLAHFLNLDRGGSFALASVQADTFVQSVQTFAESIADVANAHVVEDLVDWNFGEEQPAPRIVFDEIGSRQDATAGALAVLAQNDLLDPDPEVKIYIRQQLGIPISTEPVTSTGTEPQSEEVPSEA